MRGPSLFLPVGITNEKIIRSFMGSYCNLALIVGDISKDAYKGQNRWIGVTKCSIYSSVTLSTEII